MCTGLHAFFYSDRMASIPLVFNELVRRYPSPLLRVLMGATPFNCKVPVHLCKDRSSPIFEIQICEINQHWEANCNMLAHSNSLYRAYAYLTRCSI